MLYKARSEAIKFKDDYSLMTSKAQNQAKNQTIKGGIPLNLRLKNM